MFPFDDVIMKSYAVTKDHNVLAFSPMLFIQMIARELGHKDLGFLNSLRHGQTDRHFDDGIFNCFFFMNNSKF